MYCGLLAGFVGLKKLINNPEDKCKLRTQIRQLMRKAQPRQ
uniref:Uncharacterized protein n=1 Tax=Romanomermis culicivorax TaxID=13658 RepID=A0A915KU21_ROMCU